MKVPVGNLLSQSSGADLGIKGEVLSVLHANASSTQRFSFFFLAWCESGMQAFQCVWPES